MTARCASAASASGNSLPITGRGVNTIARLEARDGVANLLDHTPAVVARRIRQRRQSGIFSRANISFHRVNADRVHSNEHLTRTRLRRRHFFEAQNFRTPKSMHPNRLHLFSLTYLQSDINHVALNSHFLIPGSAQRSPCSLPSIVDCKEMLTFALIRMASKEYFLYVRNTCQSQRSLAKDKPLFPETFGGCLA